MQNAYRNYTPGEFVSFIQTHTGLKHAAPIGTMKDSRTLFLLS